MVHYIIINHIYLDHSPPPPNRCKWTIAVGSGSFTKKTVKINTAAMFYLTPTLKTNMNGYSNVSLHRGYVFCNDRVTPNVYFYKLRVICDNIECVSDNSPPTNQCHTSCTSSTLSSKVNKLSRYRMVLCILAP